MRLYGSYIMSGLKTIDTNYNVQSHVVFYLNKEQRRRNLEAYTHSNSFFSFRKPFLDLTYFTNFHRWTDYSKQRVEWILHAT